MTIMICWGCSVIEVSKLEKKGVVYQIKDAIARSRIKAIESGYLKLTGGVMTGELSGTTLDGNYVTTKGKTSWSSNVVGVFIGQDISIRSNGTSGQMYLFNGADQYYTRLVSSPLSTQNIRVTLPSVGGTLVSSEDLFIKSGETISETGLLVPCSGILTNSKTNIHISIPIAKRLDNVNNVTINTLVGGLRTTQGGYLWDGSVASDSSNWVTGSAVSSVVAKLMKSTGCVRITIALNSAATIGGATAASTNNTPLGCFMNFSFTFS